MRTSHLLRNSPPTHTHILGPLQSFCTRFKWRSINKSPKGSTPRKSVCKGYNMLWLHPTSDVTNKVYETYRWVTCPLESLCLSLVSLLPIYLLMTRSARGWMMHQTFTRIHHTECNGNVNVNGTLQRHVSDIKSQRCHNTEPTSIAKWYAVYF